MIYKKNKLKVDGCDINSLSEKFGTPIYCYSAKKLKENIVNFKKQFQKFNPLICFAGKANSNINILREIKKFNLVI